MTGVGEQVVVVTGGASGIGLATSYHLAERDAKIAILDVDEAAAAEAAARLPGENHVGLAADVSKRREVMHAVRELELELGPPTGLVACAGVTGRIPLEKLRTQDLESLFAINLYGAVYGMQAVLPSMRSRGAGSMVTVSSVAAQVGGGFVGGAHYAASKAALIGLTRAIAREVAPYGLRVNCVAPGPTDTAILAGAGADRRAQFAESTLLGRVADPAEVASTIGFLMGDDASFITGEVLNVNGGSHFA